MKPRIYISGRMTGLPQYNFPAFHAAAAAWRTAGWDVENPAESFGGSQEKHYKDYVAVDIAAIKRCDAIFMLPGWDDKEARGSVWEHGLAEDLDLLRFYPAGDNWSACTPDDVADHLARCAQYQRLRSNTPESAPPAAEATHLPSTSAARKALPLCSGVLDYFPAALAAVADLSKRGNDKHNPGESLHWARGKSMDHADCILRHLVDRGTIDPEDGISHSAKVAWRALALLQEELEAAGAPMSRGSKVTVPSDDPAIVGHIQPDPAA